MIDLLKRLISIVIVVTVVLLQTNALANYASKEAFAQQSLAIDQALLINLIGASQDNVHYVFDEKKAEDFTIQFEEKNMVVKDEETQRDFPFFENDDLNYIYTNYEENNIVLVNDNRNVFIDSSIKPHIETCPQVQSNPTSLFINTDQDFSNVLGIILERSPHNNFRNTQQVQGFPDTIDRLEGDMFIKLELYSEEFITIKIPVVDSFDSNALACHIKEAIDNFEVVIESEAYTIGTQSAVIIQFPQTQQSGQIPVQILRGVNAYYG